MNYLQSSKRNTNKDLLKVRWVGLSFLFTITFILLSNSNSVRLQSNAIATEMTPSHLAVVAETVPATPPLTQQNPARHTDADVPVAESTVPSLALRPEIPTASAATAANVSSAETLPTRHNWTVRSGDTLSHILQRFGVYSSFGNILAMGKEAKPLRYLRAGKKMHLDIQSSELHKIVYEETRTQHFILEKSNDVFVAAYYKVPVETRIAETKGFIHSSFYKAALDAGLKDDTIVQTARILGWDIDFALDIRKGDFFSVIHEEKFLDDMKISNGKILAVTLINRGNPYRAIFYTDTKGRAGYYSPDGRSVKKPFLRTPVEFTRVSSKFSLRRWHPILKTTRPHRGVDYAAPTGTPVFATADGRITYRGWKAGYGNVVIIRHYNSYTTVYAHLSRFKPRLRVGSMVQQEDVIGYVGMTGYATGPHLHYEFRVNGRHRDPLTIKLPDSKPLPKNELTRFRKSIQPLLAQLNALEKNYAALK